MKLFISYSREDAGDFARHVHRYLVNVGHEVFIDINSIRIGEPWANSIDNNISECDIFLVILTPDSLRSTHVENEVLFAQKENKIIVPCISEDVAYNDIKWGLEEKQGIEFSDEYKLARKLYSKIKNYENYIESDKDIDPKIDVTNTKSYANGLKQENDIIQPSQEDSIFTIENKYFKNAEKFEQLGLPEKAIEVYDIVLKKEPENFEALFKKSLVLAKITKYDEAIESLDHAINIHPDHPDVWYQRGCFLEEIKRYDDALKSFDIDLKIDPTDITTRKLKSKILEKLGKDEEHLQELDEIIKIDSKDIEILEKKGILLDKLTRYDEELECYDKLLEIKPDKHNILISKGHILQKLERYDEAVECYDKVLSSKPRDIQVRLEKCVAISKSNRYQKALECYDETIQLAPDNKLLWLNKGNILFQNLKRYKEAIDCYDKVLELDPDDPDSKKNRESVLFELKKERFANLIDEANSYYEKKNYIKVIELCDKAIDIDKRNYKPYLYKANSLQQLSRYQDALDCYDKILAIDANNEEAIRNKYIILQFLEGQRNNNTENNNNKKALIIAVSEYDKSSGLKSIEYGKNDGVEMYNVLKKNGYDIPENRKLIGYVDSQMLKNSIYDFFTNEDNQPDDTLIFYYSGHGVPDKWGETFLAPSDIDSDVPFSRGFDFDDLTKSMLKSNSQNIITILDSCFSGSLKISKGNGEDAATRIANQIVDEKSDKLKQGIGRCLLAASQGYEEAYDIQVQDHSIFTYYLLEGLKGHKNAVDYEGNVTCYTLGKFINRQINNLPSEKRPKQTPLRKGESSEEIILANYLTKKKYSERD